MSNIKYLVIMNMIKSLNKLNDDYTSPPQIWELISEYLPKQRDDIIWEPFYNPDSQSPEHLRRLGCQVIYGNIDFFKNKLGTHIVTNPPWSCKEKVVARLSELDMPFIIVMPLHSLTTRFIKSYFKHKIQIIIPDLRLHFEKKDPDTLERFTLKRTPFDTIYYCYKMNLQNDITWL